MPGLSPAFSGTGSISCSIGTKRVRSVFHGLTTFDEFHLVLAPD